MMPQVKGFTSGLSIWPRANFMNVIPACMPVVICDRGSAVSELAKGAERGLASFVGRGGANAQLRAAGAGPSSGPNPNRCRSSQLEGVRAALYGRGRGRRHPHHRARCKAQPSVCDATPGAPPALPCKPVCRNTPHRLKGTARSSHRSHRSSPSTESLVWRPTKAASVVVEHSTLAKHGLIDTCLCSRAWPPSATRCLPNGPGAVARRVGIRGVKNGLDR